jgi:hypothetical protein
MEIIEAIVAITTFVEERGYDYQAKAWWTIRAYIDKLASSGEVSPPPTTDFTAAVELLRKWQYGWGKSWDDTQSANRETAAFLNRLNAGNIK